MPGTHDGGGPGIDQARGTGTHEERGPGPHAGTAGELLGPLLFTGGGLVAVVDGSRGLRSLWLGTEAVSGPLTVTVEDGPDEDRGPGGLRAGAGRWERTVAVTRGGRVVERGLVPDVEAGVVLEWSLEGSGVDPSGGPLRVRIERASPDETAASEELALDVRPGKPATILLPHPEADPDHALRLVAPLAARARERSGRGSAPDGIRFEVSDSREGASPALSAVVRALRVLDDAPSRVNPEGLPAPPFVGGIEEGRPVVLEGAALAEVGLAALLAGRFDLALAVLRELARDPDAAASLPFLVLASRWALWTGRPGDLLPLAERIERALDEGLRVLAGTTPAAAPPLGAAFPDTAQILERAADALEPLGRQEWGEGLRERIAAAPSGPPNAPMSLPMVGRGSRADTDEVPGADRPGGSPRASEIPDSGARPGPTLPDPADFGDPDLAGHGPRRTVRAARFIRAVVEGALGADAEAGWGRLTLAPRIGPDLTRLTMRALRVGDARVDLDYRRDDAVHTFLLRQTGGRTPVDLVFEPRLPLAGVDRVRLGDEAVEVDVTSLPDGLQLRCRFPLDPERRMTIVGTR